MKSNLPPAM